jgi:type IV pilus assembly protein PilO
METLQNLDPQNIGSWPLFIRVAIFVIVFVAVFIGGNYFLVQPVYNDLQRQQQTESKLLKDYESKSFQAANLEEFKKQMEDLDSSYLALLRQLPKETEVPGLLEDITATGLGAGLKFDSISLRKEERVEFYSVLPIDLKVKGSYHGLAGFVSGVAALPRIVTLHDFVIDSADKGKGSTTDSSSAIGLSLKMDISAKTYRYQDEGGQ